MYSLHGSASASPSLTNVALKSFGWGSVLPDEQNRQSNEQVAGSADLRVGPELPTVV